MEGDENCPAELRSTLLLKTSFLGMWKNTLCELRNGELIIHCGLSDSIQQKIKITPNIHIEFYPDSGHNKFTVEEKEGEQLLFAAESTNMALLWIHNLRTETYNSESLSISDFDIISTVGRGFYGKVVLASRKGTNELSAIKCVKKSLLVEYGKVYAMVAERNILFKVNFPFITRIKFAFQSSTTFYIGMEYASGGELFSRLQMKEKFPLEEARFYISEIALTINYLHSIGIIYRDLKLENVLIGEDGHVKLCDFGLSKELQPRESTSTLCGTTEYLAPEIILGREYNKDIDWWALGILSYELIFGETPFEAETSKEIMENILRAEPEFDVDTPEDVKSFIRILLTKEPESRPTFKELMGHPFWKGINWNDVKDKKLKPPFVPNKNGKDLVENFDSEFTEEPVLSDSLTTPASDTGNYVSGFSMCEDTDYLTESSASASPQPSSLLTLDLISPI